MAWLLLKSLYSLFNVSLAIKNPMHKFDYHEPEFVRQYRAMTEAKKDHVVTLQWLQEVRESLRLDNKAACAALLQNPEAFLLHSEIRETREEAPALPRRAQLLNQASFDVMALHPLAAEKRLYGLGIMLSFAEKNPGESDATLAVLASLPEKMRGYMHQGVIETQFQQLPAIPALQRQLISGLASLDVKWELLPESPRKQTLPLQINLLALQDENGMALLQQQLSSLWNSRVAASLNDTPWMLENYLLYRLYHDVFPWHEQQPVLERYLLLNVDYFMLKTLFSLWVMDGAALTPEEIIALVTLFEQWRHTPEAQNQYQQVLMAHSADALLSAFSLLVL